MSKFLEKHETAKKRLQAASFLTPALLTAAAVGITVAAYQPLVFDESAIAQAAPAESVQLETKEVTSEKTGNEPATGTVDYGLDLSNLADGVYTGSAQGFQSTITVQVTVAGGKITAIEVVSEGDTPSYFSRARAVIDSVISQQSMSVDTVSGATYSSRGILMAIKNALGMATSSETLREATDTTNKRKPASNTGYDVPAGGLKDGVYTGTEYGFQSDITVRVTISGGKIAKIELVSEDDTPEYFNRAWTITKNVVAKQSTAVDTVSGATYSSEGILGAIKKALVSAGSAATVDPVDPDPAPEPDPDPVDPTDPTDPDNPDDPDEEVKYEDGEYTAYAKCENTEKAGAFEPYYVALTLTVKDGKPTGFTVAGSSTGGEGDEALNEYDEDNEDYLLNALEGRTFRKVWYDGMLAQIIEQGKAVSDVDVVSGATYSSKAICSAYEKALAMAAEAYEKAHPDGEDPATDPDSGETDDKEGAETGGGTETGKDSEKETESGTESGSATGSGSTSKDEDGEGK